MPTAIWDPATAPGVRDRGYNDFFAKARIEGIRLRETHKSHDGLSLGTKSNPLRPLRPLRDEDDR
jgi:hypothetical protein